MEAQQQQDAPPAGQQPQIQRGGGRGRGGCGGRGRGRGGSAPTQSQKEPESGPSQPIKATTQVTKSLPPAGNKDKNIAKAKNSATRDDAVFKEAIFSVERSLKPVKREIEFEPSCTGFTPLVNDVFTTYRGEKRQQMGKEFPPELFRYYCSCLFWLRVIGIKLSTGQVLTDAERSLKPVKREIEFEPSCTGFTPLVNDVFTTYRGEKRQQMGKEFPPELFRYYCSCLFWLRVIGIKLSTGQVLTDAEDRVLQSFEERKLSIPEPIFLPLKAIGKITSVTGDTLVPKFPDLPITEVQGIPGTLGVVDKTNHNIYEELPVIGVAIEALRERLTGENPSKSRTYNSKLAPQNTTANANLQGFTKLTTCRMESIAFLENLGVADDPQFPTIAKSGINFRLLDAMNVCVPS